MHQHFWPQAAPWIAPPGHARPIKSAKVARAPGMALEQGGLRGVRGWVDLQQDLVEGALAPDHGCAVADHGDQVVLLDGCVGGLQAGQRTSAYGLLHALRSMGLDAVLNRIDGAFAFAWWDRARDVLHLVRDRAGQRSLYYGWWQGRFLFAADAAGLFAASAGCAPVDRRALALYLRHGYVPAPHCMHAGMFKLLPGHVLTVHGATAGRGTIAHEPMQSQRPWWHAAQVMQQQTGTLAGIDAGTAVDRLQAGVAGSIQQWGEPAQAGVLLSGGVDSSLVAAVLQAQASRPIPTLAVGFDDAKHDERDLAAQVARRLGTQHEVVVCDARVAEQIVPALAATWSEPIADPAQVPMLLAARAMHGRCNMLLTGEGGDELFFGHAAHARATRNARYGQHLPQALRDLAFRHLQGCSKPLRGTLLQRLAAEFSGEGIGHHYLMRTARWQAPADLLPRVSLPRTAYADKALLAAMAPEDAVQYLDLVMELGNGLMAKVEAAARGNGLVPLAPLLAREVVELAWALPQSLKVVGSEQKWLLKALLCRYLPDKLVFRPKRGFGPPIARWLQGPLRPWAEDLLQAGFMQSAGIQQPEPVLTLWAAFQSGQRRLHPQLWTVLVYLGWYRHNYGR